MKDVHFLLTLSRLLLKRVKYIRAWAAPQSLWGAGEYSFSSSESAQAVQQQEPVEATDRKVSNAVGNPPA